jgi:hypothetical protein
MLVGAAATIAALGAPEMGRSAEFRAPTQDPANAGSPSDPHKPFDTVTIEGRREVKRQIDAFVCGVLVTYLNDSLVRWDAPVCPMVEGLP